MAATQGPLLLLAGAGSGKTRVLTHRVAYLIQEMGVPPWNILAITFTNKAAGEMRERVDSLVGAGSSQVWVATFHSTCLRILRRYIDRLGFDNHFTIYDTDDQKSLVRDICRRLQIDTKQMREREFMGAISSAKDQLISPTEYQLKAMGDFRLGKIASVYLAYQEELKKNNGLDFDDLLMKTVELFKACPEVLEQYQDRFRYIMVDEYQDTNTAQFELIRLLAGGRRNLCVVGDDDQSIYRFRGANIRNILDFEKIYPDARVIRLEQNYRSTGHILEAANAVIRNNAGRKEKTLWTSREKGPRVRFRQFENGYEEAEFIAEDIARLVKRGQAAYGECAVLYRTNAQSRLLEESMVTMGLPYRVVGGVNFYARKEIKDILAYLKTVDNGRDDVAVKRILNVPRRGIGDTSLDRLQSFAQARGISFFEALEEADRVPGLGRAGMKIAAFVEQIRVMRTKAQIYGIKELIRDVIESIGYAEYLRDQDGDEEGTQDRLNNLEELMGKAAVYSQTHEDPTLSEFLEEVALVADIDSLEGESERVLLMTLHSAKGLEFSQVYLAGMEDGLFPGYLSLSSGDSQDMEEERRLAYVGITRAKDQLTLTCARTRMVRGETQRNAVSRFVREIPGELLDSSLPGSYWEPEKEIGREAGEREPVPAYDFRPRAFLRSRATAQENKPFIAQGIDSLNRIAGISKGVGEIRLEALDYGEGDRVNHTKYGEGTVLKIDREPRDYKVTVLFDRAGQKIMYASFAKLKRVP